MIMTVSEYFSDFNWLMPRFNKTNSPGCAKHYTLSYQPITAGNITRVSVFVPSRNNQFYKLCMMSKIKYVIRKRSLDYDVVN